MHQVVNRPPEPASQASASRNSRSRTILIVAIVLFAISGLGTGFAMGTVARPKTTQQNQGNLTPTTAATRTTKQDTPVATATKVVQQAAPLGCPSILAYKFTSQPDGTTPYTFTAQANDKSSNQLCNTNNKALKAANITFKLWLIPRIPDGKIFIFANNAKNKLKNPDKLQDTLQGQLADSKTGKPDNGNVDEVQGLTFDQATPQVCKSDKQGQCAWKYTILPNVPVGAYSLVVLSDWNGTYYNWSWASVAVA